MIQMFVISLCIVSLVLSIVCLFFIIKLFIEVRAKGLSTHSIQYVPVDQGLPTDQHGFEVMTKKTKETLENDELDL